MTATSEKEIQCRIVKYLKKKEWVVTRSAASNGGAADLCAEKNGITIYIEVKRPGGTLGFWQARWLSNKRKEGYRAEVVFSVQDFLKKFWDLME